MFGQLFRPAQETGIMRGQLLASDQHNPIDHSPELNMSNGNCLCGSDGANFNRLTEHLVFAFLGGCMSIDNLPCLGDLVNGIDGTHQSTPSSRNSYPESSQIESLDLNGNLHQLSAISMDLDFNPRIVDDLRKSVKTSECYRKPVGNVAILLDLFDASSTARSPLEHTSQRTDKIELLPENSINAHIISNKFANDILNLDCPTTNLPFQLDDFPGNVSKINNLNFLDFLNCMDSNGDLNSQFKKLTFKLQKIGENQKEYDLHEHALTSGNLESQFHRHHKNLNDVPVSYTCPTRAWNNKPINDGNTFSIPNPGTLMDYLYGDLEIPQLLDAESSGMQLEDSCCIIGNNGEGPTFSVPDPSKLMNFLYGNLESPVFLSSESIEKVVHSISNYADRYSDRSSERELVSQSADHTIGESHQCSLMNSWAIPKTIVGLMTKSFCDSNGFTNEMDFNRVRIHSSSQFEKENSEISDSKLPYHRDIFIVVDPSNKYKSEAHTALATEPEDPLPKNPTNFVPTISSLLCKSEDDEENMKMDSTSCTSTTDEPSLMNMNSVSNSDETLEIYVSSPCFDQKVCTSSSPTFDDPCLLGYYDSDDGAEVTDLSDYTLNDLFSCYNNTISFLIKSKNGSLAGAFEKKRVSDGCEAERISSDSSFFDLSDHYELLEMYGLSNQEQYTDTGYSCESPSWPGKSGGQTQRPLTCLTSNLTDDDAANGILTADSFLFHANTDEISVMNKSWTNEIYERNSENSVSLRHLNHMECAFETSLLRQDSGSIDCVPLLDSCRDDFEDSIKHQSLKNDFKFAFPDPSTLRDYLFGSLDSPRFLASELLDGNIDNLHYRSLFGGCELDYRTEEADLSDKMLLDQCRDCSINKFSCSVEFPDVRSPSFDISDHDELLEWYGIKDQDQLLDGNWTCDSPTWPGKM